MLGSSYAGSERSGESCLSHHCSSMKHVLKYRALTQLFFRPWNQTDTVDETVPQNCHNGTFRWDYPQGTINLKFPMANGLSMSVCLRDFLGGDIFIIHDITDGQFIPIEITDRWNHMDIDTPGNVFVV